ncbi:MAG: leucine-rich repeat domain-containing protein [Bacteroidota bacterium]|nr:leucine-rich repeat domain-containing protein [Bacteroidota bacterium]
MNDLDIIKQIEEELNIKLKKLYSAEDISSGFRQNIDDSIAGLILYDCDIKSLNRIIKYLKNIKNLTSLDLRSNSISDISLLKDLTELKLMSNNISDISVFKDLTKLTSLDFSFNTFKSELPRPNSSFSDICVTMFKKPYKS